MSNVEEHILALWLQNPKDEELISQVSTKYDIVSLKHHLHYIDDNHLLGKNVNESWLSFQQKIARKSKEESNPIPKEAILT